MDKPNVLYMDGTLEAEIRELLPDSGKVDFSDLARHLFRVGISAERERRRLIPQTEQAGIGERFICNSII
jgi:hypothetical protein